MSAFFKLLLDGEERDVEVTRDCELVILDYDMAWDDMLGAMSGQESDARLLLNEWLEFPTSAICDFLVHQKRDLIYLVSDWVAHVMPVVGAFEQNQYGEILQACLNTARNSADAATDVSELQKAKQQAVKVSWEGQRPYEDIAEATVFVLSIALSNWPDQEIYNFARRVAWRTEAVVRPANLREGLWQVRHFVHAMECVQAGKDWPSITETP